MASFALPRLLAEETARAAYAAALACEPTHPEQASDLLRNAIRCNPWVGEPWLALARWALLTGDRETAVYAARRANELFGHWGCAWDKRRALAQWRAAVHLTLGAAGYSGDE